MHKWNCINEISSSTSNRYLHVDTSPERWGWVLIEQIITSKEKIPNSKEMMGRSLNWMNLGKELWRMEEWTNEWL